MATFITYQGCRVAPGTLAAFKALAADFKKATGFDLQLTPPVGGARSYAEQGALYHAYLAGGTLAASPDNPAVAMHLEQNARALDVHDTGPVPGVTTAGSPRNNVLAQLAPKHGFVLAGLTFRPQEGWHIEYQGDQWAAPTKETPDMMTPEEHNMLSQALTLIQQQQKRNADMDAIPDWAKALVADVAAIKKQIAAK